MNLIWKPLNRILNNPSLMALLLFATSLILGIYFIGRWLVPVIISVIIAYLLEGVISKLEQRGIRRIFAVCFVFLLFSTFITFIFIALVPVIMTQAKALFANMPFYLHYVQEKFYILPERFPQFFTENDINNLIAAINTLIADYSRQLFSNGIFSSVLVIILLSIYIILIPILIFFMLKDKHQILDWLGQFMPKHREIIKEIWNEVDIQIGNYIRGKFIEIIVIWLMCFIAFHLLNLQYSLLLSFMVGLSVLIPYIGATLVTIPVLVVGYMQYGLTPHLGWISAIYFIIQTLDGNVIVPLIFSEVVNIHPVAIIIAILIFGGIWGFWGVFFAIPLATLVNAIIKAWQRYEIREHEQ